MCVYHLHPCNLCLSVDPNNLACLHPVVPTAMSPVGWNWRIQTAHAFSWDVWYLNSTSSWRIYGLLQSFDPICHYPPIRSYNLSRSCCWPLFDKLFGWPRMHWHMSPSIWLISLDSFWGSKYMPRWFYTSSMTWWSWLGVSICWCCWTWGKHHLGGTWWYQW